MISSRFDRVATLISAEPNINQETISITNNIPKATNNEATLSNSDLQSRISNIHYSATTKNMSQNLFDLMQDRKRNYYSDRSDTDSRPSMQLLLLYYPTVFHIIKDAEFFTDSRVNEVSDITILTNNTDIMFRFGMHSVCSECYEAIVFHERNVLGKQMNQEEIINYMKTDSFNITIDNIYRNWCRYEDFRKKVFVCAEKYPEIVE